MIITSGKSICAHIVTDILSALETTDGSEGQLPIHLPSARSVAKLWSQSEGVIALPQGCQTTIANAVHAFGFALALSRVTSLAGPWQSDALTKIQTLAWKIRCQLGSATQWETTLEALLSLSDNHVTVMSTLANCAKMKTSDVVQRSLAQALQTLLRSGHLAETAPMTPLIFRIAESDGFLELHEDLRITIITWLSQHEVGKTVASKIIAMRDELQRGDLMTDIELHHGMLTLCPRRPDKDMHRRKRRRLGVPKIKEGPAEQNRDVIELLAGAQNDRIEDVPDRAVASYVLLDDDAQCQAWRLLADLVLVAPLIAAETIHRLVDAMLARQSKLARTLCILAIGAAVNQVQESVYLDLVKSPMGKLCLSLLHSSVRELRIAAGHTLPSFLRGDLPNDLKHRNRRIALEYLRNLSDRDVASEHETLISAWGQVAVVCDEREILLVLLRLVDYLGHPNPLVSALGSTEIEKLAITLKLSIEALTQPFMAALALTVVHDLLSRPQKIQQLCDLMGIEVKTFLLTTQKYTIPSLVMAKRKDILERIAIARGKSTTVRDLCLQPRTTLASIVALLLMQPAKDLEASAMDCLIEVAPEFRGEDVGNLVKLDPTLIACEMLKQISEVPATRKPRALHSIQVLANITERRPGQSKIHAKPARVLQEFLEHHMLGIMTFFSSIVYNASGPQPQVEKLRCVKAVAEMMKLVGKNAGTALPQIRAFYQSAVDVPSLREEAFAAWLGLLDILEGEDIAVILDQTFALIAQHWPHLSTELHQAIFKTIGSLLQDHNKMVQDHVATLPSLSGIPLLSKYSAEMERLRLHDDLESQCKSYMQRLRDESETVILHALGELVPFLQANQAFIHDSAISEQPAAFMSDLLRTLLDVTTKYASQDGTTAILCAKALGAVGSVDPNRIEAPKIRRQVLALSDFDKAPEAIDWVIVLFEDILVKEFKSATNTRAQGFLAYVMQELLKFCHFNDDNTGTRTRSSQVQTANRQWTKMPEHIRLTLTPFLTSSYVVTSVAQRQLRTYPGFTLDTNHSSWLRALVVDLMWTAKGDNPRDIFQMMARLVPMLDLALANFILPYMVVNRVLGGTVAEVLDMKREFLAVLECEPSSPTELETAKLSSQSVFAALDYMSTWMLGKKRELGEVRAGAYKTGLSPNGFDEARDMAQIETIEKFMAEIPAAAVATRAVECGSYARALFNWEQFIRQKRNVIPSPRLSQDEAEMYSRLFSIYAEIDEPDGLAGLGAHLSFLSEEQQVVQHTKAGRWTAAQAWYELQLDQDADAVKIQASLLGCLRETGQFASGLRYGHSFLIEDKAQPQKDANAHTSILPLVLESHWMTGDYVGMEESLNQCERSNSRDFNVGIAGLIVAARNNDAQEFVQRVSSLRKSVTSGMTEVGSASIQACHEVLVKLHTLYEVEALYGSDERHTTSLLASFDKRLDILGSYSADKLFVLGVRRALMQTGPRKFTPRDIGPLWLATARIERKAGNTHSAYSAVLQAYACGDQGAKLEEARLLWHDGHQRQAIQALEAAVSSGVLEQSDINMDDNSDGSSRAGGKNMLAGRAHLLLAKWLDASGQSQTKDMTAKYQYAAKNFQRWEKGHYYLGKHYNKLLEAEKGLPKARQSPSYTGGEMAKLIIENLMRSIPFGNKYWHEVIPRILTLWLDLGMETMTRANKEDLDTFERRQKSLLQINKQMQKYFDRIPPYVWYTALPQMISRISHPNLEVWKHLCGILAKIGAAHPSQALWSMIAVGRATDKLRADRGASLLLKIRESLSKAKNDGFDLRSLITNGQKLSDGLLQACEAPVESRVAHVSLSKDLRFNHKLAPNGLVVPIETTLSANLPSGADSDRIRRHKAFVHDKITIQSFADDVLVLSSLQRPRKLTVRGSDGKQYGLLCKPKDDLRKDQRLMEFNGIINRALKRDAESSKRRLYIKTYAVTPLSEESGCIEWVEGIKPIRDILLGLYARRNTRPNYTDIRNVLNQACASPEQSHLFVDQVLNLFPAVMHEWFNETYSEPDTWFAARLRYARSAAVMSIVGHVLGLGDRHGENILLEEGSGGVFHVDFNCLFDKGLTFEKPELVPFRLTHNMVDAMGAYGYEGPFRRSSELTYGLLRQNKDTLMTVL